MSTIEIPIESDEWERIVRVAKATAWDDRDNPPVLQHPFPGLGADPQWRLRCIDGTLVDFQRLYVIGKRFFVSAGAVVQDAAVGVGGGMNRDPGDVVGLQVIAEEFY